MTAVPVPHTWIAGDDATSTVMQTLTDAILFLLGSTTSGGAKRALAVLTQTVIQTSIATGTGLTFDAESADYDNGHSTVTNTNRYTAATAGYYDVQVCASLAGNTTGTFRTLALKINGTTFVCEDNAIFASAAVPNVTLSLSVDTTVFLNAGDYIEAVILHNATALNTALSNGNSRMCVKWASN